jgi:hypothetical protein
MLVTRTRRVPVVFMVRGASPCVFADSGSSGFPPAGSSSTCLREGAGVTINVCRADSPKERDADRGATRGSDSGLLLCRR